MVITRFCTDQQRYNVQAGWKVNISGSRGEMCHATYTLVLSRYNVTKRDCQKSSKAVRSEARFQKFVTRRREKEDMKLCAEHGSYVRTGH